MRLLVSVRNEAEALLAACGGADFIDLKEARNGALGGLPPALIGAIVKRLRDTGIALPVSATIGDLAAHEHERIGKHVAAVGACGVDYVKVGIAPAPGAAALLEQLGRSRFAVVPVFLADQGLDWGLLAQACSLGFPALMVDTADKRAGSLFDCMPAAALRRFIATVRAGGKLAGLAGALRLAQLPALQGLAPDFAGFRSAVCVGDRGSALDPQRLGELSAQLRRPQQHASALR
jgi:uncharacterized protein (UPF0264 family)